VNRLFTRIFAACLLLAGHVPAIAFVQASQCEMACCRKAENTSCHRSHKHSGPGLIGAPCISACGGVTVGMTPALSATPVADALPQPLATGDATAVRVEAPGPRLIGFSLFQRPPPGTRL